MITDGRTVPCDEEIQTDICVIGAGPAGITVTRELAKEGFDVLLLERGPDLRDGPAAIPDTGFSSGIPYRLARSHAFAVGGSIHRWHLNTPLGEGFGRLRELDEPDFEVRPWVRHSGWPLNKDDLRPFYQRARELFEWRWPSDEPEGIWDSELQRSPFSVRDHVQTRVFYLVNPGVFAGAHRRELENSQHAMLLTHSVVAELRCDESESAISSLVVKTSTTHGFSVRARAYVLAGGGIENPRLLLTSRARHPVGLGNGYDLVGRFFMEHPHYPSGSLIPSDPSMFLDIPNHDVFLKDGIPIERKYGLADELVEREQLTRCVFRLNAAPITERLTAMRHGESATRTIEAVSRLHRALRARRWSSELGGDLMTALSGPHHITRHVAHRVIARLGKAVGADRYTTPQVFWIRGMAEQVPNPESRVTLSSSRDAFGVPMAVLDWRLTDQDVASMKRTQELFGQAQLKAGHCSVESFIEGRELPAYLGGGNHHMGTTRMADSPREGVVDRHGRVHDVGNLYVAGSSVFPTSGYANPTLTLLALALRLADHLARTLDRRAEIDSSIDQQ